MKVINAKLIDEKYLLSMVFKQEFSLHMPQRS